MKTMTALLVGVAVLAGSVAGAQDYSASVSGVVLSTGPEGFMLRGPDGNYGIVVTSVTVITDPWTQYVASPGCVQPGDIVTAYGYATDQWIMRSTDVVIRGSYTPPANQGYFGWVSPNTFSPSIGGITYSYLPAQANNTFLP